MIGLSVVNSASKSLSVQAVRMLALRLQRHQVDDVDDADLQLGRVPAQQVDRGQGLERRHVAAAGHHDVGLRALVVAGPLPDAEARRAVLDRLVHRQPLRRRLLARHDDVDVVAAAQAVVGDREQAVGVGRQVDADDLRLLVHDVVDEARVLVAEAVVVLPPDMARQQVVQRGDRPPPGDVVAHLQPLGVLVEHRIDDVDEGLVAGEEAVPAGQQIAFEPALALVLAEHLHHPPVGGEVVVVGIDLGHPGAIGDLEHILPAVGVVLVRAEQAEVPRLEVQLHDVAQERRPSRGWPRPSRRREPAPRPRSRGSRAAAGRAAAARRWRAGWRSCAASPCGGSSASSGPQAAVLVEQLLGPVALHPAASRMLHVARVLVHLAHRHLVRAPDSPRCACRRSPWGRSSPWACAARSSASGAVR